MKRLIACLFLLLSPAWAAEVSDTTLKGYFEAGDVPTQSNFIDLIDSKINKPDLASTDAGKGSDLVGFVPLHTNEQSVSLSWVKSLANVIRWIPESQWDYILTCDLDAQDESLVTTGLQNAIDDLMGDYPLPGDDDRAAQGGVEIEMVGCFAVNDSLYFKRPHNNWSLTGNWYIESSAYTPILTWYDDELQSGSKYLIENGSLSYDSYRDLDDTDAIAIAIPNGSSVNIAGNNFTIRNMRFGFCYRGISNYDVTSGAGTESAGNVDSILIDKFFFDGTASGSAINLANLDGESGGAPSNRISNGWIVAANYSYSDMGEDGIALPLGGPWVIDNVQFTRFHARGAGVSRGTGYEPTAAATNAISQTSANLLLINPKFENCTVEEDNGSLVSVTGGTLGVIGGRATTFAADSSTDDDTDRVSVFRTFQTNVSLSGFQMNNSGTLTNAGNHMTLTADCTAAGVPEACCTGDGTGTCSEDTTNGEEYLYVDAYADPTDYSHNFEGYLLDAETDGLTPADEWEVVASMEPNLSTGLRGDLATGRTAGAGTTATLWSYTIPSDSVCSFRADTTATDTGANHGTGSFLKSEVLGASTSAGVRSLKTTPTAVTDSRVVATGDLGLADIYNSSGDVYYVDVALDADCVALNDPYDCCTGAGAGTCPDTHGLNNTSVESDSVTITGTTSFNTTYDITYVDADTFSITQTGSPADENNLAAASAAYEGKRQSLTWTLSGNDIELTAANTYAANVDWMARIFFDCIIEP